MKGGATRGPAPSKAQADDGADAAPSSAEQVEEPEYLSGEEDYIDSDSEGRDGYRRGESRPVATAHIFVCPQEVL